MAPKKTAGKTEKEIEILTIEQDVIQLAVVGTTGFICNRVSEKVKRELLAPRKKTAADRAQNLKHQPLEEYRSSPYTLADGAPTLLAFLAVAFKKAAMTAALHIPGAKKAEIGRLVRVRGERIPLYGVPQMLMAVTKSADMNRTPDIRTRAIIPRWAALLEISFVKPALREKAVLDLFAAGGMLSGVGDWRIEKGSGDYGAFRLAAADDPELLEIMESGRREAQIEAMNTPTFYDDETEALFNHWLSEAGERGFKVAS